MRPEPPRLVRQAAGFAITDRRQDLRVRAGSIDDADALPRSAIAAHGEILDGIVHARLRHPVA